MTEERKVCVCDRRITDFEKIPQPFTTTFNDAPFSKRKVGEETKEGIEANREILKQMQREAPSNEFKADD